MCVKFLAADPDNGFPLLLACRLTRTLEYNQLTGILPPQWSALTGLISSLYEYTDMARYAVLLQHLFLLTSCF